MNRLFVRDLLIVVASIAAITAIVLSVSSHHYVEHRSDHPQVAVAAGTPAQRGAAVFERACSACHTTDGTAKIGPTFLHDYGSTIVLDSGATVAMDEAYIRESLANPRAKSRPGYPPSMPSFEGVLKERDVAALVAYLQSLR